MEKKSEAHVNEGKRLTVLELMVLLVKDAHERIIKDHEERFVDIDKIALKKKLDESLCGVAAVAEIFGLKIDKPIPGTLKLPLERFAELVSGTVELSEDELETVIDVIC